MSDLDDCDPWDLDELDRAILDLNQDMLRLLLPERLPSLTLMPDLDAVDFSRFSRLARIPRDTGLMVFVAPSAIRTGQDGSVWISPDMYPEHLWRQAEWNASWRERNFGSELRSEIARRWRTYYWTARSTADCPEAGSRSTSSTRAVTARHLRAAARGFRRLGDVRSARRLEDRADDLHPRRPKGRPKGRQSVANADFRHFLRYIFWLVEHYGGRLRFDRLKGTGSRIQFIDELRPLLPPGFAPTWKHPPSFIATLATAARQLQRGNAADELFIQEQIRKLARELCGEVAQV